MTPEALLNHAYGIALAPLAAFALIIFFRNKLGFQGAWVGILALTYALGHALLIAIGIFSESIVLPKEGLQGHFFEWTVTWFSVGTFEFRVGVLIDGLSSVMLCVVTLISLMVQIYSTSYMHDHKRFGRYFAYVNLFTFAMLILVMANEMLQFFVGWEIMGLCSYLLIGFDFEREAAAYAGRKAFLTTRVGDLGFYAGLLVIFNYLGTFNIPQLHQNLGSMTYPSWVLTTVPLLLFCGAMGKSAQVPLHVWLPDAMEGPTPASALIHAATMVAAGVYLVARVFFLFQASPVAMETVAWVGVTTAVVAASMGLVASDIKRVLAFSTVSQLGFMMTALGCGGYTAGVFHLTTHAAFKALLFLCAGSVIHAVHTNDMWKMGGLKTQMPITAFAYLVGTLAIAGCWPFAGFFSKEEILTAAYHHNPVIFALLAVAALMTSFYMFRTWFLTFTGLPREKDRFQHAHEAPFAMAGPLLLLSFVTATVGFFFWYHGNWSHFVTWGEHAAEAHEAGHEVVLFTSLSVFLGGLVGAFLIYSTKPPKYEAMARTFALPYRVLVNKYKFDELYLWIIDKIYYPVSNLSARLDYDFYDQKVIDGFGRLGTALSWISGLFDFRFIDTILVDGEGVIISRLGRILRYVQSGFGQTYLYWMTGGLIVLFVWVAINFS